MEALSSPVFVSRFSGTSSSQAYASIKPSGPDRWTGIGIGSLMTNNENHCLLPLHTKHRRRLFLALAAAQDISGQGKGQEDKNGFHAAASSEDIISVPSSLSPNNPVHNQGSEKSPTEVLKKEMPAIVSNGSGMGGGTRAGLFRTPISGGVQSATSAHGLPRPALAVRNLMEQARFAHLCTVMSQMHHRREGYPFGSLVDFAPDPIPGGSGLSNARVTIFGDVFPLTEDQQDWAHKQYIAKHHQGASQQWGNFYYFRMQTISDIYFIGGFGTVAWVDVKEYEALTPDKIAVDGGEQNLKELNLIFSRPLKELLSTETDIDDAALISIDSRGTDVRVRQGAQFNVQRLPFEEGHAVETLEEAKIALQKIIDKGHAQFS